MIQGARQEPVIAGTIIDGKYRLERELGRGAVGVVFVAHQLQRGEPVAIKFLLAGAEVATARRFVREARAIRRIENDHVPRIYDVGQLATGQSYLVMELLDGHDLSTIVEQSGSLPVAEAVDYSLQTCVALAHAHQLGIVHRDIKPENIFLTHRADGSPLVKLLDFGIAKVNALTVNCSEPTITQTGVALGSPRFMSPEQLHSTRSVDQRTDIWSLGVVLHELLSGQPAFGGDSLAELCVNIMQDPPAPLLVLRPELPPELVAVIGKCLQKEREQRYRTVGELAAALAPFGGETAQQHLALVISVLSTSDQLTLADANTSPQKLT